MNLPNFLTTARFVLSFVMVYFIFEQSGRFADWALVIFLAASLTDYWDGRLARKRGQTTIFGALMDPIADKTLTLCAFLSFWKLDLIPGIWVAAVASRDAIVTAFRLFALGRGETQAAWPSGKRKTFFQVLYISSVLAYLWFRQREFWQRGWDGPALLGVHAGMLVVVFLVMRSGFAVLRNKK